MNVIRCTIVDDTGGVSFITHGDALPALVAACTANPHTLEELLDKVEPFYQNLKEYVLSGLALFDESNVAGCYDTIHRALGELPGHRQPVFRVVDEVTQEASLRPVKAGAVIFNLKAKRIIQIINSYREIRRSGSGRIFNGISHTDRVYRYRLPEDWALVP
ncbi:MAG: hypothetical protein ACE5KW_06235 [Dehalococcoidia bacterium]